MHLSAEECLDLIEERASDDQVRLWNAHLHTCSSCSEHMTEWKQIFSSFERRNLEDAPHSDVRVAQAIFTPPTVREPAGLREVFAALVRDSFTQPALAGARGQSGPRQILFSTGEFDIHFRIWSTGGRRHVAGQILSRSGHKDFQGAQLYLSDQGRRIGAAETDRSGEFMFEQIPVGPLDIVIDLPELRIRCGLDSGDSAS